MAYQAVLVLFYLCSVMHSRLMLDKDLVVATDIVLDKDLVVATDMVLDDVIVLIHS